MDRKTAEEIALAHGGDRVEDWINLLILGFEMGVEASRGGVLTIEQAKRHARYLEATENLRADGHFECFNDQGCAVGDEITITNGGQLPMRKARILFIESASKYTDIVHFKWAD